MIPNCSQGSACTCGATGCGQSFFTAGTEYNFTISPLPHDSALFKPLDIVPEEKIVNPRKKISIEERRKRTKKKRNARKSRKRNQS